MERAVSTNGIRSGGTETVAADGCALVVVGGRAKEQPDTPHNTIAKMITRAVMVEWPNDPSSTKPDIEKLRL